MPDAQRSERAASQASRVSTAAATATKLPARCLAAVRDRPGLLLWPLGVAALVAATLLALPYVAPNADPQYGMLTGDRLARLERPYLTYLLDHPLLVAVGVLAAPLDAAATIDALSIIGVLTFISLLYAAFRLGTVLGGRWAGLLVVLIAALSPGLVAWGMVAAVSDVGFAVLVLLAIALVAESPRRPSWGALAALVAAGLLRPEAWLLSILYAGWLAWCRIPRETLVRVAALAVAAPIAWGIFDLIVAGDALHSTKVVDEQTRLYTDEGRTDGGYVLPTAAEQEPESLTGIPGGHLIDNYGQFVSDFIGWPLLALGALVALFALWPRAWPPWPGQDRLRFQVPGAVLVVLSAGIIFIDNTGYPMVSRYLIAEALLFAALAAGGARLGTATILPLIAIGLFVASDRIPSGIETIKATARVQEHRNEVREDLAALASRQEVTQAVSGCPALLVRSRSAVWADFGRIFVALEFGRDWNEVPITKLRRQPRGYSEFRWKTGSRKSGSIRGGGWVFTSPCTAAGGRT